MPSRILVTLEGEPVLEHEDGSVSFSADADIDADGSGGNPFNDPDFQPETSYRHPGGRSLNAITERFIVVPPAVIRGVKGVVLGCQAHVMYKGRCVDAVVGDVGPTRKLGEISIAAAEALGIPSSPVNGGVDGRVVHYRIWPGTPAVVIGVVGYRLQPSG